MGGGSGVISCASISPAPGPYKTKSKTTTTFKDRDSSRLTILDAKSTRSEDKHLPPVGLQNVGNTCYANAALQCILSTALSHALLDPKSAHIFRRYSSNPGLLALGSGSVDSADNDSDEGQDNNDNDEKEARRSLRQKARETRRKNREKILKHENCQWLTGELTDITRIYTASHMNLLGDQNNWNSIFHLFSVTNDHRVVDPGGITRHVNKLSPCLRPYQQEDAHEFLRSLLSSLTLDGHNKELSSLFDGLLESAVTCQTCHRASITRDRYMDLSLDIQQGDIKDLMGALSHFTQTELLDEDNKVHCDRCRTKRVVSKGLRLATAPTVLVCHLKRFSFDVYGRTRRLSKHVRYPLSLEIGEFMSRANQSKPPPYELVGVLVHAGKRCESGHYLAFIKCGERWYKANDEVVVEVSVDVVLQQQAYILFYEVEGMRIRHGYRGFRKYHRQKNEPSGRDKASVATTDGVNSDSSNTPDHMSTPSKVTSLMDGMLNLCGSVETVRDAICDSDRKQKKKKSNNQRDDYFNRDEPLPSSSSLHRNTQHVSSKKKNRRKKDDIFRKPSERPVRASTDPRNMNMHRDRFPEHPRDFMISDGDNSVLSTESRMIRSVSSNNMFEKEEEALSCYENESYASRSPRRQKSRRSRRRLQSDRSMSPVFDFEEDVKSDTSGMEVTSSRLFKTMSNESYASRTPHKTSRQRSRNQIDRSISPPIVRASGFDGFDESGMRGPSSRQRKFSSAPRSRTIKEDSESQDLISTPAKKNLNATMYRISPLPKEFPNDSKLPPLPPK